jgi:hypothetical protein
MEKHRTKPRIAGATDPDQADKESTTDKTEKQGPPNGERSNNQPNGKRSKTNEAMKKR